jgi:Ca2+-binding EF-hand superfamily protein
MARYNRYVEEIRIDITSKIITFFFDDGESMYMDNGELAEILTTLQIGSIVFLGHSYSAETVDELLSEMAARVKEDIDCLKKGMCQAIQ